MCGDDLLVSLGDDRDVACHHVDPGDGVPQLEGGAADLQLEGYSDEDRPIPVRVAHVTRQSENLVCRAGLSFDVTRMQSEDVARLLRIWRTLLAPTS